MSRYSEGDSVWLIRDRSVRRTTVESLTPSGQVRLSNGVRLTARGSVVGEDQNGWGEHTRVTTDEREGEAALRRVRDKKLRSAVRAIKWEDVNIETIAQVLALVDPEAET